MTGFDFLHDSAPEFIDAIRGARVPRRLRAVASAFVTLAVTVLIAVVLEAWRLHVAAIALERAETRFEASRAAIADLDMQTQQLEALLAQDRILRRIRLSGPALGERLATLGNLFPRHVWVTSMSADEGGYDLKGQARDLATLELLLANLVADHRAGAPRSINLSRNAPERGWLAFELGAGGKP